MKGKSVKNRLQVEAVLVMLFHRIRDEAGLVIGLLPSTDHDRIGCNLPKTGFGGGPECET
jgi:hypothetical protein